MGRPLPQRGTRWGSRHHRVSRPASANKAGLMDPAEYHRHIEGLVNAPMVSQSGEWPFLATLVLAP